MKPYFGSDMMEELTHTHKRILVILRRKWRFYYGNSWYSFRKLSKEINRPEPETKRSVREMANMGIVKHNVMVDTDGVPCGSGYFLTTKWDV